MLNEIKFLKTLIQHLQERESEITDEEKDGYSKAQSFLDEYLMEVQDDLEFEYSDNRYGNDNYYNF